MASDDRRHQAEEKTYAVFSSHSINTMAESVGLPPVNPEAAATLGEDASYRIRQVINVSLLLESFFPIFYYIDTLITFSY